MQYIANLKIQEQVSKFPKKLKVTKIDSKDTDILNKTMVMERVRHVTLGAYLLKCRRIS